MFKNKFNTLPQAGELVVLECLIKALQGLGGKVVIASSDDMFESYIKYHIEFDALILDEFTSLQRYESSPHGQNGYFGLKVGLCIISLD